MHKLFCIYYIFHLYDNRAFGLRFVITKHDKFCSVDYYFYVLLTIFSGKRRQDTVRVAHSPAASFQPLCLLKVLRMSYQVPSTCPSTCILLPFSTLLPAMGGWPIRATWMTFHSLWILADSVRSGYSSSSFLPTKMLPAVCVPPCQMVLLLSKLSTLLHGFSF